MEVMIDGKKYREESEPEKAALRLLAEVYGRLWAEAFYDPLTEIIQRHGGL